MDYKYSKGQEVFLLTVDPVDLTVSVDHGKVSAHGTRTHFNRIKLPVYQIVLDDKALVGADEEQLFISEADAWSAAVSWLQERRQRYLTKLNKIYDLEMTAAAHLRKENADGR